MKCQQKPELVEVPSSPPVHVDDVYITGILRQVVSEDKHFATLLRGRYVHASLPLSGNKHLVDDALLPLLLPFLLPPADHKPVQAPRLGTIMIMEIAFVHYSSYKEVFVMSVSE